MTKIKILFEAKMRCHILKAGKLFSDLSARVFFADEIPHV